MYKRFVLLWLALALLLLPALPAAAETTTLQAVLSGPEGTAAAPAPASAAATAETASELLVTYPDAPTAAQCASLAGISRALVSLGRTADFLPEGSAAAALPAYDGVLCYGYTGEAALGAALAKTDAALYFLGCAPPAALVPATGHTQTGPAAGVASYPLAGGEVFTSAVEIPQTVQPAAPTYTAGALSVLGQRGPLATGWGTLRYLPLTDYTTPFAQAVLTQELALWRTAEGGKPGTHAEYLVLDEVCPFTDPDKLLALAEQLATNKTPYAISVMPIYANADFPAMQQFCEVLRYAQANGGTIVLHAPLLQNAPEAAALQQKLTEATQSYVANGVYPVALEIPASWVYDSTKLETLGRYRTLLLYDDAAPAPAPEQLAQANRFLSQAPQLISPAPVLDGEGISYLNCCATALYLSVEQENETLLGHIQSAVNSAVPLGSLWAMRHAVTLDAGGLLEWNGTDLTVNGAAVSLTYTPQPYPENHDYKRNIYYRATADLSRQNHLFIAFALVALLAFLLFILLARYQMHRRFYLPPDPDEKDSGKK